MPEAANPQQTLDTVLQYQRGIQDLLRGMQDILRKQDLVVGQGLDVLLVRVELVDVQLIGVIDLVGMYARLSAGQQVTNEE